MPLNHEGRRWRELGEYVQCAGSGVVAAVRSTGEEGGGVATKCSTREVCCAVTSQTIGLAAAAGVHFRPPPRCLAVALLPVCPAPPPAAGGRVTPRWPMPKASPRGPASLPSAHDAHVAELCPPPTSPRCSAPHAMLSADGSSTLRAPLRCFRNNMLFFSIYNSIDSAPTATRRCSARR